MHWKKNRIIMVYCVPDLYSFIRSTWTKYLNVLYYITCYNPFQKNFNFQEGNWVLMCIFTYKWVLLQTIAYKYHSSRRHWYALENFQRLVKGFKYNMLFFGGGGTYLFVTHSMKSPPHMLAARTLQIYNFKKSTYIHSQWDRALSHQKYYLENSHSQKYIIS